MSVEEEVVVEAVAFECPKKLPLFPDLDETQQTLLVLFGFGYIAFMTIAFLKLYSKLDNNTPVPKWFRVVKRAWPLLGFFPYLVSGIQFHFVQTDEFLCITPPNGTWGWWYMPVSKEIQLEYTGYIEVIGGVVLVVCGMLFPTNKTAIALRKLSSLLLFLTTIGMTFANTYMLTHGVWAFEMEEPFPFAFHVVRFTVQAVWLSNLSYMASHDELVVSSDAQVKKKSE